MTSAASTLRRLATEAGAVERQAVASPGGAPVRGSVGTGSDGGGAGAAPGVPPAHLAARSAAQDHGYTIRHALEVEPGDNPAAMDALDALLTEVERLLAEVAAMSRVVHAARIYQLEQAGCAPEVYREAFLKLDAALVDLYREVSLADTPSERPQVQEPVMQPSESSAAQSGRGSLPPAKDDRDSDAAATTTEREETTL